MSVSPSSLELRALRRRLRQQRRALSASQRRRYAHSLARQLSRHPLFIRSRHIACYLPNDGEMSLEPLIRRIWQSHKHCYLPVLQPGKASLWFRPYRPGQRLRKNRFQIPEPSGRGPGRRPWALDLVLMPLVGFDALGHRLGMGGGYYDRCFAYLRHRPRCQRPRLIGIAYAFQQVPPLQAQVWDVPLRGVVTERGWALSS